jgi:ribosomal protein L37AE/L43A
MTYEPRKPVRLVERQPAEKAKAEVKEAANRETCPECGSTDYHMVEGCHLCRSCGYTPCGHGAFHDAE